MSDPVPVEPDSEGDASADAAPAAEPASAPAPVAETVTAGMLLRQARQARGLHIAALATSIKVAPRKLEMLEADRFDELPDATFTRALAQTVCRTLKIDAAPVLALLPQPQAHRLDHLSQGLNAPFRDKPLGGVPTDLSFLRNPGVIGAVLLALAAAAVYLLPSGWIASNLPRVAEAVSAPAPAPADAAASDPLMPPVLPPNTVVETVTLPAASAPAAAPSMSTTSPVTTAPSSPTSSTAPVAPALPAAGIASAAAPRGTSGALLLKASAESWIEVIDGRGTVLVSRSLQPGESLGLDGASPLHVRIGNVSATTVTYRGRAVSMTPTRDNIAKFDLE
ncbi:helix-turn-helix domain-containing protein [Rhizobacter sp. OV335]|uniref:helix-turn-helix domain-containing protein n=1 Tax=Rhizobacter sp. OV335 TaxID=1500264 RepID=UPI000918CB34|nr:helix-turn-helix domain-containing protein [Rhizobacter sp. OV335]SHM55060.1 cytoskeleton protein RodZ [Rhizobacter sp. OV335]